MKRSASTLLNPEAPRVQVNLVTGMVESSPNQFLKNSIKKVEKTWRRELKNYMSRKDDVDGLSLSRTKPEEKFWPLAARNKSADPVGSAMKPY